MNNRIALATLVGAIAITLTDAPDWSMRPYLGFVGAMIGSSFIAGADQALGESIAILVLGAVLLRRGEQLGRVAQRTIQSATTPGGGSASVTGRFGPQ